MGGDSAFLFLRGSQRRVEEIKYRRRGEKG